MSTVTQNIGRLIELIAGVVSQYGNEMVTSSFVEGNTDAPGTMDFLAYAYFATDLEEGGPGLIYWINDKLIYWIEYIKTNADWSNFSAFLTALADAGLI